MNPPSVRFLYSALLFLSIIRNVPQTSCGNASASFSISSSLSLFMTNLVMFFTKLQYLSIICLVLSVLKPRNISNSFFISDILFLSKSSYQETLVLILSKSNMHFRYVEEEPRCPL
ncbi:hypothetical protein Hdeb2414_s0006g00217211 [Helianthus debilis subsp. tardiflorus]